MGRFIGKISDKLLTAVLQERTVLATGCTPFCECNVDICCGWYCVTSTCHIIFYGCGSNGCHTVNGKCVT
jgi:hypothetical protein